MKTFKENIYQSQLHTTNKDEKNNSCSCRFRNSFFRLGSRTTSKKNSETHRTEQDKFHGEGIRLQQRIGVEV